MNANLTSLVKIAALVANPHGLEYPDPSVTEKAMLRYPKQPAPITDAQKNRMYRDAVNPPGYDQRLQEYANSLGNNMLITPPLTRPGAKAMIPASISKPAPISQSQMSRMINRPYPTADERLDDYLNNMEIDDALEYPGNRGSASSIQYMPPKPEPIRSVPYLPFPVGR